MMRPQDIAGMVDDRPQEGIFRVHADAFRRQDVFDLEMKHIFEATWVFVGLESQIPNANDFFTTMIGRQPVIVTRTTDGKIHCLLNTCRHRGAMVCSDRQGNRRTHICPYHAWTYDNAGRNVSVTNESEGAYTAAFAQESHDLKHASRVESYRGFIFASLSADVPSLADHLGDTRVFIDLAVDQGSEGVELVPGSVSYTYNGNWKMQSENGQDSYHFIPTHISYLQLLGQRKPASLEEGTSAWGKVSARDLERGSFTFKGGHNVLWGANDEPQVRAVWLDRDAVRPRVGDLRFDWMLYTRNVFLFPNMALLDASSLQVRVIRPLAANKTEVSTYCIAPKGESAEARLKRIRQYEEFYNPTGFATPDDLAVFDACQAGLESEWTDWHQGYMRGMADVTIGANAPAKALGIQPLTSVSTFEARGDETLYHPQYREWVRLLVNGMEKAGYPERKDAAE